jgi:hypothetical protein
VTPRGVLLHTRDADFLPAALFEQRGLGAHEIVKRKDAGHGRSLTFRDKEQAGRRLDHLRLDFLQRLAREEDDGLFKVRLAAQR